MVTSGRVHTEPRGARPVALVLVAVGLAVAVGAGLLEFRLAGYLLAVLLATVALLRLLLPVRMVASLAVRSRGQDAATTALIAVGLAVLARTVPS